MLLELAQALCASLIGREMGVKIPYLESEQAAIVTFFKNLGRLLVASNDYAGYYKIVYLVHGWKP